MAKEKAERLRREQEQRRERERAERVDRSAARAFMAATPLSLPAFENLSPGAKVMAWELMQEQMQGGRR